MNIKDVKIDNKKLRLLTFGIVGILASLIGMGYAFFVHPQGGDTPKEVRINSADLRVQFIDTEEIVLEHMMPGQSVNKSFSVVNEGTSTLYYDILWDSIDTTIVGSDFVYTLTSSIEGGDIGETVMPKSDEALITNVVIAGGTTHTYTLTITFKNMPYSQNANRGATFKGRLILQAPYTTAGNVVTEGTDVAYVSDNQYEEYLVPDNGYYHVELWGASGATSGVYFGGKGGYTSGKIYLRRGEKLYIYLGGEGTSSTAIGVEASGGNNGGGKAYGVAGSGGGATDVRYFGNYIPGEEDLENDSIIGLNSRIMVAGGGGGAAYYENDNASASGGNGGGLIAKPSTLHTGTWSQPVIAPTGGTQTSGGLFGYITVNSVSTASGYSGVFGKASYESATSTDYFPGAGGGYYGGGAGPYIGAAGGSSFISGYAGSNAITELDSATDLINDGNPREHTNNTLHYSSKYFIDNNSTFGTNTGIGRAKITYLGASKPNKNNIKLNNVRYIKDCANGSSYSTTNFFGEIQAIKDGENVAFGKTVKLYNSTNNIVSITSSLVAVDGSIELENLMRGTSDYTGYQCLVVDLGANPDSIDGLWDLDELAVWHRRNDGETYYNNTTYVASTNTVSTEWTSAISNYVPETSEGKRVSAYDYFVELNVVANGGDITQIFESEYQVGSKIKLETPTRSGYKLTNWSVSGTGSSIIGNVLTIGSNDTTLTANWELLPALTIVAGDGTWEGISPQYLEQGSQITINNPIPPQHYYFDSWIVSEATSSIVGTQFTMGSAATTLTARYNPTLYSLTYNLDGGAVSIDNPTGYNITSSDITLNNPIKDGYVFIGWTGSNGTTPQMSVTIEAGSSGNKSYTANYTLSFVGYLENLYITTASANGLFRDGTIHDNLRYTGSSPLNYVTFNGEVWRIIGIFSVSDGTLTQKRVKIVKNAYITSTWGTSNNWNAANMKTYLNSTYYNGLSSTAKSMINSVVWNTGGLNNAASSAITIYNQERGTTVYGSNLPTWTGIVGLEYASDYAFASTNSSCRSNVRALISGYNDQFHCKSSNWLYKGHYRWLMGHYYNAATSTYVTDGGQVRGQGSTTSAPGYPAVFLSPNVLRVSGTGTSASPYQISL